MMRVVLLLVTLVSTAEGPPAVAATDRFSLVLDGAAVRDQQTGLIWEREPSSEHMIWSEAPGHCDARTVSGERGWRLPNVKELVTLVDGSQLDPALPKGHPFQNIKSAIYWTATPSETDEIVAWHVSFYRGEAVTDQKSQTRRVWCVRAGSTGRDAPAR